MPSTVGKVITTAALEAGATSVVVSDAAFTIQDDADATKEAVFQASGISTATRRTYTLPNASGVMAILSGIAQTFANTVLFSGTGGFGYTTGAGTTVTQITSKATGVTINRPSGLITTHNAALAAGAAVQFTVTNSAVAITDTIIANVRSPSGTYRVNVVGVAAGSFVLELINSTGGSLSEAVLINFNLIRGINA